MGFRSAESRWSADFPAASELLGYRAAAMVERASDLMALLSHEGTLLYLNRTGRRVLGMGELEPGTVLLSHLVFGKSERKILSRVTEIGEWRGECCFRHQRSGAAIPMEATFSALMQGGSGSDLEIALEARVTAENKAKEDRRSLQTQLQQAIKMEAVGRLAAGISDHFNNLLTANSRFSEIVLDELEPEHGLRAEADETLNACHRTAAMIRQLLAVGRRQALEPLVTSSNHKVQEMVTLLHGLIGEDIVIETELAPDPAFVRADPAQLEQVLIHLMVNARDAMPAGGKLIIRTETVDLDEAHLSPFGARGPHVRISVTDTGHGMDSETLAHVFEPFFSTKERGTGLGLATVYGIVSQSGGHVAVDSRPGGGATFAVYLPAVQDVEESTPARAIEPAGGG